MNLNLTKREFLDLAIKGEILPLYAEIPYIEPYIVYEYLRCKSESIILESIKGNFKIARYSFIAYDPYLVFKVKNGEIKLSSKINNKKTSISLRQPLQKLKELISACPQKSIPELPPFQGGAIGLLSYDFVRYIENIKGNAEDDLRIPDAHFLMVDKVIAFDHMQKKAWIIVSPLARNTEFGYKDISDFDFAMAYEMAEGELKVKADKLSKDLKKNTERSEICITASPLKLSKSLIYEMPKSHYMDMVKRAKEYISSGDIFQANLSQRISTYIGDIKPWDIYKVLRKVNPAPFAAYADFGEYQIVSSSPERLVRVKDNVIETRPIAGTRPRGKDFKEDEIMRAELLLNEKERAEHIMLIDLERNDIGKVSEYGSVVVDELMTTEDYSHVIHIVSNIKGTLRTDKNYSDVIMAVFPGGTITGVPKVRCMEIIDELEPVRRGCYTGSLGYIDFSGNVDLNIIIRTLLIKDKVAYVQAGAGIVADSDPEKEYYETLKKAEALIKTLQMFG